MISFLESTIWPVRYHDTRQEKVVPLAFICIKFCTSFNSVIFYCSTYKLLQHICGKQNSQPSCLRKHKQTSSILHEKKCYSWTWLWKDSKNPAPDPSSSGNDILAIPFTWSMIIAISWIKNYLQLLQRWDIYSI